MSKLIDKILIYLILYQSKSTVICRKLVKQFLYILYNLYMINQLTFRCM